MAANQSQLHIMNKVYDSATDTLKTTIENADIAIELSATDGDSVVAVTDQSSDSITSGDVLTCSGKKKAAIYIIGTAASVLIEVSANGTDYVTINSTGATDAVVIKDICATHIRVTATGATSIQVVLQG